MKRKMMSLALALVMCLTLCVPAFAATPQETEEPPTWVEEGETWVLASDIIMPMEDDSCPQGHWRPDGFVYQGYTQGNTQIDGAISAGIVLITSFIPGIGTLTQIISLALLADGVEQTIRLNGRVPGNYIKYVYTNSQNNIWYHIVWMDTIDGWPRYLTCTAY
ncbi:hypothetical protein [Oscillibacter sp.]|uniref:hypothetical protein n=1 Tax=Oscillibacter sp. TaxID=1945593 RepID=UPI0028A29650|nr:hypothetical protein [Oscillibacter sp.]